MATLTKSTVVQAVFENIYDRMNSNVTSVTLSDNSTPTIQTYTGAFPDKDIDDLAKYPICVINSPNFSWEEFTFTKKEAQGTFSIDIYTTKAEAADKFIDAIIESIETYRTTLGTYGMVFVNLQTTDYDMVMREALKVHMRSCTFSFKFKFTKT